jgi:hypothetical protein
MNSAELIKRMQQRAAARATAAALAANKPENAQNAPVNQSSGWRRVVDVYAGKTAERAASERCARCHFTKQDDGWCYWQDTEGKTEWLHHWIKTPACRAAPVRSEYMTLAQRDDLARRTAERGANIAPLGLDRMAAAVAKKALDQESTRMLALEFWAKNQDALEAAGWSEDSCIGMMCRAGIEIGAARVEGGYIVFNKWTRAKARQARQE